MSAQARISEALAALEPVADRTRFVGPAPAAKIHESERMLGVTFPPSYREFLERVGAGSVLGREVYGVVPDPAASGPPNVVSATLSSRQSEQLPNRFLILVEMDDSSALALELGEESAEAEAPVVRIWPGEHGDALVDARVAPDFASFFSQFVRERVELAEE
jgi:antitoxin YobK